MSKSLKNFITIRQALENNTSRQIRMCFLLHKYNAPMDYGDNTMSHALVTEKIFIEFFHNCKAALREGKMSDCQKWNDSTKDLQTTLNATQIKVDEALRDDFDTPSVISVLIDLVKATNIYMENPKNIVHLVIRNVAVYVTRILSVFGLTGGTEEIGFDSSAGGGALSSREEILTPVLDALMEFRSAVRDKARANDVSGVLMECDSFRDGTLLELGIRLEDKTGGKSVWKLADPEQLQKEKEQKALEAKRKEEEKAAAAAEKAKKDAMNSLCPIEYMKQLTLDDGETLKYSMFDESGMPTHGSDKMPLNKNQSKKALKEFQGQQKKYEKCMQQKS
jgi:cysteinyl-tRNA synthetase